MEKGDLLDKGWELVYHFIEHPAESIELDEELEDVHVIMREDPDDSGIKHFLGLSQYEPVASLFSVSPYMAQVFLALLQDLNDCMNRDIQLPKSKIEEYQEHFSKIAALIGRDNLKELFPEAESDDDSTINHPPTPEEPTEY